MASHGNPEVQEVIYPDSVSSWGGESEEGAGAPRVRFMCSYGGRILPRPHDNQLRYVGGETRIVAVSRHISYSLLSSKLSKLCGSNVTLKYQLPNEDLDALISVTTEEDLDNMMEEYDRLVVKSSSSSSPRLRLFLFPAKLENATSLGSLLEGSKREHWFVDALNGMPILSRGRSEVSSLASDVPDYLFGLDNLEDWDRDERASSKPAVPANRKSRLNLNSQTPEVHSAPGSPMPESSPYGSTSSAPPCIDSGIENLPQPVKREGFERQTSDIPEEMETLPEPLGAAVPQEIGLRTQDPRLVFEDHMTKMIFKPETAMNKNPPEGLTKGFNQLQISREHSESFEAAPESQPATIKPAAKSPPPIKLENNAAQADAATIRREGSSSSVASMRREGSGTNLSAYGEDPRNPQQERNKPIPPELRQDEIYKPSPEMLMQQQQQQQQYVAQEQHYVEYTQAPQYVHAGQMPPATYWQMHDDGAVPMYFVPSGAPSPSPVPLPRQQPAYMPVQRIPASAAFAAPAQPVLPPGHLVHNNSGVTSSAYPPKTAGKIPVYRGPSRAATPDPRIMMRPPAIPSSDQYGYAYETANPNPNPNAIAQQMYYTQKATLMNPPYQGVIAAPPVTVDLQAAPERMVEGQKSNRVSQSQ